MCSCNSISTRNSGIIGTATPATAVSPRPDEASIVTARSIVAASCSSLDPASLLDPAIAAAAVTAAALTKIALITTTIGTPAIIWDTSARRRTSDAGPRFGKR